MALSVSGFPEPLRQLSSDTEEPSLLGNNARLRGLFGKKTESKPLSRQNTEEIIAPTPLSVTPRSSQMLASPEQQAYFAQMTLENPSPVPPPQRQRQISLSRKTPPPVKRQPSLGRLEIGSAPRVVAAGPVHALPKPPTLVVQEWASKPAEPNPTLGSPRPLPTVPNPGPVVESSKSAALRAHRTPASKVLLTTPTRPRAHTAAPHAVSVRYQPLVVDLNDSEPASAPASAPAGSKSCNIRPLPRIPPGSASTLAPSPQIRLPRHVPRPARVKRPKTSPSSSNGFGSTARSPFDAVPSSWASRPVDLNPSQPTASTSAAHTVQHPAPLPPIRMPAPRRRSHSRTRRDRSADTPGARLPSSPLRRVTPVTGASACSATTPPPSARHTCARTSGYPSPSSTSTSPTSSPRLSITTPPNRYLSERSPLPLGAPSIIDEETGSTHTHGSPTVSPTDILHSHPVERLSADESPGSPDSLEPLVFIDDQDDSSLLSRSPSPMRYARPSSRGSLSSSSSHFSRSRSRSRTRAIRDQLRAYRRSYRGARSPSRSPSPIAYARRSSLDDAEAGGGLGAVVLPQRRHTQPRSYQFDYRAAQESSPFIAAVAAVAKSNSGKSKKRGSKGSPAGDARPSRSRSPRRSRLGTPRGSVIDISVAAVAGDSDADSRPGTFDVRSQDYSAARRVTVWGGVGPQKKREGRWVGQVYNDENAVVVTTIQPKEGWQEEDIAHVIPRLRQLKLHQYRG